MSVGEGVETRTSSHMFGIEVPCEAPSIGWCKPTHDHVTTTRRPRTNDPSQRQNHASLEYLLQNDFIDRVSSI